MTRGFAHAHQPAKARTAHAHSERALNKLLKWAPIIRDFFLLVFAHHQPASQYIYAT